MGPLYHYDEMRLLIALIFALSGVHWQKHQVNTIAYLVPY